MAVCGDGYLGGSCIAETDTYADTSRSHQSDSRSRAGGCLGAISPVAHRAACTSCILCFTRFTSVRRNVCDDSLRVGFYPGADHSHVGFGREFLRYILVLPKFGVYMHPRYRGTPTCHGKESQGRGRQGQDRHGADGAHGRQLAAAQGLSFNVGALFGDKS